MDRAKRMKALGEIKAMLWRQGEKAEENGEMFLEATRTRSRKETKSCR